MIDDKPRKRCSNGNSVKYLQQETVSANVQRKSTFYLFRVTFTDTHDFVWCNFQVTRESHSWNTFRWPDYEFSIRIYSEITVLNDPRRWG